jgi:hypothetical protein
MACGNLLSACCDLPMIRFQPHSVHGFLFAGVRDRRSVAVAKFRRLMPTKVALFWMYGKCHNNEVNVAGLWNWKSIDKERKLCVKEGSMERSVPRELLQKNNWKGDKIRRCPKNLEACEFCGQNFFGVKSKFCLWYLYFCANSQNVNIQKNSVNPHIHKNPVCCVIYEQLASIKF